MKISTKRSIDLYVNDRVPPGGFLYAVLCNDLTQAFAKADLENRKDLFEITAYLYNECPSNCWGSSEKVRAWLEWDGHASDCAVHNEPAYPNGPCDCDVG